MGIIRMIVVGLIVGLLARFFYPGAVHLGFILTVLLGVVGSVVGGFIARTLQPARANEPFQPAGIILSVIGGMIVILVARLLHLGG